MKTLLYGQFWFNESYLKENKSCEYCVWIVEVVDDGADEAVVFRFCQILKFCQQLSQLLISHDSEIAHNWSTRPWEVASKGQVLWSVTSSEALKSIHRELFSEKKSSFPLEQVITRGEWPLYDPEKPHFDLLSNCQPHLARLSHSPEKKWEYTGVSNLGVELQVFQICVNNGVCEQLNALKFCVAASLRMKIEHGDIIRPQHWEEPASLPCQSGPSRGELPELQSRQISSTSSSAHASKTCKDRFYYSDL